MNLNEYIEILKSLLTPLIAIIMVYIAFQQWRTNHLKTRFQLFDLRLKIYNATMDLIFTIITQGIATQEHVLKYDLETVNAKFLFGDDINEYLSSIREKATALKRIHKKIEKMIERNKSKNNEIEEKNNLEDEIFSWFTIQPDKVKDIFSKYLDLSKK